MTLTAVLLICTAGIAVCAAFVFLVETVVAFWLHDHARSNAPAFRTISIDAFASERPQDKAA